MTQEYLVYSKENWQSMAEKEPPFGYDDNFQTAPRDDEKFKYGNNDDIIKQLYGLA